MNWTKHESPVTRPNQLAIPVAAAIPLIRSLARIHDSDEDDTIPARFACELRRGKMADPVWYYARGEVERGPFTLTQIKALANASKLRPDDLVWKEGMENWTAARDVAELFPPASPVGDSAATNGSNGLSDTRITAEIRHRPTAPINGELRNVLHRVARVLTVVGVLVVVGTRGCESLSERNVTRLNAVAQLAGIESSGNVDAQKRSAEKAALEHQGFAFLRGIVLYMGLTVLLMGATGFVVVADRHERWLGVGLILVVLLGVISH